MKKILKPFWFTVGVCSTVSGFIMIPLPLPIPGVWVLALVSLPCFIYSSDRCRDWLLNHPWCGKQLRNWYYHRAIDRKTKKSALVLTAGGTLGGWIFTLKVMPSSLSYFWVSSIITCVITAYMLTRPLPPDDAAKPKA